jgi:hypothetical protein
MRPGIRCWEKVVNVAQPEVVVPGAELDAPRHWLGSTPLLDLDDPKLRLRVRSLTQLCKSDREKAVSVYRFVKRLPVAKPMRMRLCTARQVLDAGRGDAKAKATLAVAMLRIAGIPARIRWIVLRGEVLRGLTSAMPEVNRPVLEMWLDGDWQQTDTYIYDADTMAAARQLLKTRDWAWGFGIHVTGRMLWDGLGSAFMASTPDADNPMFVRDLGCYHDPAAYMASPAYRSGDNPLLRRLRWRLLGPWIDRAWRALREQPQHPGTPSRKPS